jgi:DNA mismatch repair protein MutL
MTIIRILPEILSNKIAAGEVVQRPSFVVKELVENSLDAGATSINVEIEKGGKSLIRISDNGCGLCRDDALLSIERYATSKIFTTKDLFCISTMGFRGEALPSIAAVSKFTFITKIKESDIGTKIDIAGGKLLNVSDIGAPVGTMVEVKNLFFNTPARKKFLKSEANMVWSDSENALSVVICALQLTRMMILLDLFGWSFRR